LEILKESLIFNLITKTTYAKEYTNIDTIFYPSANHCSAINELTQLCDAEINIFCDYDMAFLIHGWDVIVENILKKSIDVFGAPYGNYNLPNLSNYNLPPEAILKSYQLAPNLTFLCVTSKFLNKVNKKITYFNDFLIEHKTNVRLIDSLALSRINKIDMGNFQVMDSGWEIPHHINEHSLNYQTLEMIGYQEQTVLSLFKNSTLPPHKYPEVYLCNGDYFICHFTKGSTRVKQYPLFDHFKRDVTTHLNRKELS
jgi:hypothetical protein